MIFIRTNMQTVVKSKIRKDRQETDNKLHTHTPLTALFSGTTRVSRYQKGKTNLDFTEARNSEWQWHQLGHMQVCISLETDNHASTTPLKVFLQAGCPSCRPTNSVKALKAKIKDNKLHKNNILIRTFSKCSANVKVRLFRSFCLALYDIALWNVYKVSSLLKFQSC